MTDTTDKKSAVREVAVRYAFAEVDYERTRNDTDRARRDEVWSELCAAIDNLCG